MFLKVDLSLQDSGPFLCEGGSSEPTEPPGYGPVASQLAAMFIETKGGSVGGAGGAGGAQAPPLLKLFLKFNVVRK